MSDTGHALTKDGTFDMYRLAPWKPGDLVTLKSGGPVMTVNDGGENSNSDEVWCYFWSVPEGKIVLIPFHRNALVPAEAKQ